MSTGLDFIETGLPDMHDVPLDTDARIGDSEYARIFRRIGMGDDPVVSAFNSSI
jgi:hypothetical protein